MSQGRFEAGKYRECYRPVICPGARQISMLLNQCNQEFTRLNQDAFLVFRSPSAVGRISMHAYMCRYIIESYRICSALIYASIVPMLLYISSIFWDTLWMQTSCLEEQYKIFHSLHWSHKEVSLLHFCLGMRFLKHSTSQDKNCIFPWKTTIRQYRFLGKVCF